MDEIVVRIMRTVACRARLQVLSFLIRHGETTPVVLSHELSMARPMVSTHLRRLAAAGLVLRRHSAAKCYCKAGSSYRPDTPSGAVSALLAELLSAPEVQLPAASGAAAPRAATLDAEEADAAKDTAQEHSGVSQLRNVLVMRLSTIENGLLKARATQDSVVG